MNTTRNEPHVACRAKRVRSATPIETTVLALIVVALFAAAWLSGRAPSQELATETLRVRPGQTLWSIAREHPSPGRSTAETVQFLAQINGLEGVAVAAGAMLEVPAAGTPSRSTLASR